MKVMEDTSRINAMYYLDEHGEVDRQEFLEDLCDGWHCFMLYIGAGYVPLRVAVRTNNARRYHGPDLGSACETFEEWARNNGREDELTPEHEWLTHAESIPFPF